MKKRLTSFTKCLALGILCLISLDNYAQRVASLEVNLLKPAYGLKIPVSINLDGLTYLSDSPPDHYHHYGIWNPWSQVEYEGDTVDFWNINSRQGTVRFAKFVSVEDGPLFSEFGALHEHVVFKKTGKEKVAMNELQRVRVYGITKTVWS